MAEMGRPTGNTPEAQQEILEALMEGKGLVEYCKRENTPARSSIHKWLAEDDDFSDRYARAREVQADVIFDECLDIADQYDSLKDKLTVDHINRARLRIDTRKWTAGKLRPKKYGDKVDIEHSGKITEVREIIYEAKPDWAIELDAKNG